MSSAPDAHAHDAFDGEPATSLPADEPRSPGWLPLLGLALFAAVGVYFLVVGAPDGAATRLAPMDLPAPAAPPVTQVAHATPVSGQAGADTLRKMTPEQVAEMKKKIDEAKAKGAMPSTQGQGHP